MPSKQAETGRLVIEWKNQKNVATPGNLLELNILGLHDRATESESLDEVEQVMY